MSQINRTGPLPAIPNSAHPIFRWAGGKRWLVPMIQDQIPNFSRYVEPFFGSGAVYFSVQPSSALISDANPALMEAYVAIAKNWRLVWRYLRQHAARHSDNYYYRVRSMRYRSIYSRAAQLIYLNRTCWNGLYRVNHRGNFNVPRGTKNSVILSTDDFSASASLLSRSSIHCDDFEAIIEGTGRGDFIYVDPPYTVAHNHNAFLKYNKNLFSWSDQIRLKDTIDRAVRRGARVLISNANHDCVFNLYDGYNIQTIARKSVIAGDRNARRMCSEILIRSY